MVFPLIGALALSPTLLNIASKVGKFYQKSGNFGQSSIFGIGYGSGTAVGYNLVPQFGKKSNRYSNKQTVVNLDSKMPYNRSYSRRYSYRSRYGSRYPRRRYGYRTRRSYYGRRYY